MESVQSVDRAFRFLSLLVDRGRPVTAADAAQELELPRPTIYRLAETFIGLGLVARTDAGFRTTQRLILLGNGFLPALRLQSAAHPFLQLLVARTGETAGVHVRRGTLRRCIDEVEGQHGIRWSRGTGFTASVWSGAVGHVLLSGMEDHALTRFAATVDLTSTSHGSITDVEVLLRRVRRARERGWSESRSETVPGAAAIAAPVWRGTRLIAAINLYAPEGRAGGLREAVPLLVEKAAWLSVDLAAEDAPLEQGASPGSPAAARSGS